jgi:hypothetical protein
MAVFNGELVRFPNKGGRMETNAVRIESCAAPAPGGTEHAAGIAATDRKGWARAPDGRHPSSLSFESFVRTANKQAWKLPGAPAQTYSGDFQQ